MGIKDGNMDFEWDENKRQVNISKHGIDFVAAISIFDDQNCIEAFDGRNDDGKERIQVIGCAKPGVLFVVYTERHSVSLYGIVSARKANKKEKALYNAMFSM